MGARDIIDIWKGLASEAVYQHSAYELEGLKGEMIWQEMLCEHPELVGSQLWWNSKTE